MAITISSMKKDKKTGFCVSVSMQSQWLCLAYALLLTAACHSPWSHAHAILDGITYIESSQNGDGTWERTGTATFRSNSAAVDGLFEVAQTSDAYVRGLTQIANATVNNNDWLARQTITLSQGQLSPPVDLLLDKQNDEILDPNQPGYPGRGWGIEAGFDNDVIDTALALRALLAAGLNFGLSVVDEQLAVGEKSAAHSFSLPAASNDLFAVVRSNSGTVRLELTTPSGAVLFLDLAASTTPTRIGPLPVEAGIWQVTMENRSATTVTYQYEIQFLTPDGFDASRVSTALSYLGLAQNADGGWGITPGTESHLLTTGHALLALGRQDAPFGPRELLEHGVAWLAARQNPDGGFGAQTGTSTIYETALALMATLPILPDSPTILPAVAFLQGAQASNGSWHDDTYQTAIAVQALAAALRGTLDIDDNGQANAETDGLLLARYLFGLRGAPLVTGAVAADCGSRCAAVDIEAYIASVGLTLDVDDNTRLDTLTDALLALRALSDFHDNALIDGAVAPDCGVCSARDIERYVEIIGP